MSGKRTIARTTLANLSAAIVLLAVSMGGYWVFRSYLATRAEIESFREHFIGLRKQGLRDEVNRTLDFVAYKRSQTESRVRAMVRERVYEAHAMATHIYKEYHERLPREDIHHMVREALRPIRFSNGRGYFFATRLDGVEQLFADRPELENRNLLDMRDAQGKYVIRDMIDLVKREGEGYYAYRWTKPEAPGRAFQKESFVKYFEPFDWFIGTGEYLDDMEREIQREVLERISSQRDGKTGYMFVVDREGVCLAHIDPSVVGRALLDSEDSGQAARVRALMDAATAGGGFVEYDFLKPDGDSEVGKISYAGLFEPWGWMVGTGAYLDEMETIVARRTAALERRTGRAVLRIVFFVLLASALALVVSYRFSRNLEREFTVFSRFFEEADRGEAQIDPDRLSFDELRSLGRAANEMVARRSAAERAARAGEDARLRLTTIVEQMSEGVVIADTDGVVEYVNPAYEAMTGNRSEDAIGRHGIDLLVSQGHSGDALRALSRVLAGEPWSGRVETERPDGGRSVRDISVSPVRDSSGEIVNLLAVERDVTETVRLEGDLRQAQKMEAVGQLAGGIAHDFNNLLQVILGHADLAMGDVSPASSVREDLGQIQLAGTRASTLVRQLLTFSRRETVQLERLDLSEVIGGLMKMLGRLIGEHIELSVDLVPGTPCIEGDRGQVEQILLNLCVNARDAMPQGGQLSIRAEGVELDSRAVEGEEGCEPGTFVLLTVSDTGEGIPQDLLDHVFEPFFTTKEVGQGTGLGLATVYGVVRRHGGLIEVDSRSGEGTTFRIYLPAFGGAAESKPESEPEAPGGEGLEEGRGTVLLAEDDEQVRKLAQEVLGRAGYCVLSAGDGEEALSLFERNADEIDVALLDVVMPKVGGPEVRDTIRSRRPGMPVVFATGYSRGALSVEPMTDPTVHLIHKPYRPVDLLSVLREALAGSGGGF